jgi:hypothetical protein
MSLRLNSVNFVIIQEEKSRYGSTLIFTKMILSKVRPLHQTKAFTRLSRKEDGVSRKTINGETDTGRTTQRNMVMMHYLKTYSRTKKRYLSLKG